MKNCCDKVSNFESRFELWNATELTSQMIPFLYDFKSLPRTTILINYPSEHLLDNPFLLFFLTSIGILRNLNSQRHFIFGLVLCNAGHKLVKVLKYLSETIGDGYRSKKLDISNFSLAYWNSDGKLPDTMNILMK